MSWTQTHVETLRKMWGEGYTCQQIANHLACGISRNAVIGKVHRLGLSKQSRPRSPIVVDRTPKIRTPSLAAFPGVRVDGPGKQASDSEAQKPTESKPSSARAPFGEVVRAGSEEVGTVEAGAGKPVPVAPKFRILDDGPVASSDITIMEIRNGLCRWPKGDPLTPEFRYCGAAAEPGHSYCGVHHRIAYEPRKVSAKKKKASTGHANRVFHFDSFGDVA